MSSQKGSSSNPKSRKQKQRQPTSSSQDPPVQPFVQDPALYYPQMVHPQQPQFYPQSQSQMYPPQQTPYFPQSQSQMYPPQQTPFYPQQQPGIWQMRQQVSNDSEFQVFPDSQTESVPETQYPTDPISTPKADPSESEHQASRKGKSKTIPWEETEERDLGKTWVDVSEDPIVGNDQKGDFFWNRVTKQFLKRRNQGNYRKKDAISTKFRNMNKYAQVFNGYYMTARRDWGSGMNDTDIINKALEMYADEKKKKFTYQGFWEEVRHSSKWQMLPDSVTYTGGSKRSKQADNAYTTSGSEANFGINLNDDDDEDDNNDNNDEEEVEVRPTQKKVGRDKAKAMQRGVSHFLRGSGSDAVKSVSNAISGLKSQLDDFKSIAFEKQKSRDMKLLMKNISHLSGDDLETALKIKADIKRKYNL